MKHLIYQMAFGARWREWAKLSYESLRTIGRYTGDYVVFTDDEDDLRSNLFPWDKHSRVIQVPEHLRNTHGKRVSYRIHAHEMCDFGAAEVVGYTDVDVLFVGPMDEVVESNRETMPNGGLTYCEEPLKMTEAYYSNCFGLLGDADAAKGRDGITSGAWFISRNAISRFCREWGDLYENVIRWRPHLDRSEQPMFDWAVLHSGWLDKSPLKDRWYEMPKWLHRHTTQEEQARRLVDDNRMYHFVGIHDNLVPRNMRWYLDAKHLEKTNFAAPSVDKFQECFFKLDSMARAKGVRTCISRTTSDGKKVPEDVVMRTTAQKSSGLTRVVDGMFSVGPVERHQGGQMG